MSTDAHRPTSRITEALFPPPAPAPEAPAPADAPTPAPAATASAAPQTAGPSAAAPQATAPGDANASRLPLGVPPQPTEAPAAGASRGATGTVNGPPPRPETPPRTGPAPTDGPARPVVPAQTADVPAVETTTRLRPIRDTGHDATPAPVIQPPVIQPPAVPPPAVPRPAMQPPAPPRTAPAQPEQAYGTYGAYRPYTAPPYTAPPETLVETTTRLRPIRERSVGRVVAAGACLVLGIGLVGGAIAGAVLATTDAGAPAEPEGYAEARTLWHSVPVDTLFPRTLAGPGKGPGSADRTWTRVVVAADTPCTAAVLPKSLLTTVQPVGCERVLRATYTDATATSVITVGLVFTQADAPTTRSLAVQSAARLGADVPPALSAPGTVAARFGAAQRASWSTRALTDLPVVVTAVSGFADGRRVAAPEPAEQAMADDQTSPAAQAGLGHEAKGVADRIESALRETVTKAAKDDDQ